MKEEKYGIRKKEGGSRNWTSQNVQSIIFEFQEGERVLSVKRRREIDR